MSEFYTYLHRRNDTGEVFYVGKGRGYQAWRGGAKRSAAWAEAATRGHSVEVLVRWQTEAEAFEHERFLVACFRDLGAPLVNRAAGGAGMPGVAHSETTKDAIRRALAGRVFSAEHCARIGAAKRGVLKTPEAKANMRKAWEKRRAKT